MKLLERSKWPLLEPLFDLDRPGHLFALGALRGNIGSLVYADSEERPRAAVILARNGWHAVAGRFDEQTAMGAAAVLRRPAAFARFPEYGVDACRCVSLSPSFDAAKPFLDSAEARERELTTYRLSAAPKNGVSDGFEEELLTIGAWPELERLTSLASYCWEDAGQWARQGLGFLARRDGALLGAIYSCCVAGDVHEPHLALAEGAEQAAVGAALARRFARACEERGLSSLWSCWTDGSLVRSCAEKAGFLPMGALTVTQFARALPEAQRG